VEFSFLNIIIHRTMDSLVSFMLIFMLLITHCDCEKELRLLGLQPMTGTAWPGGWACFIPIQLAIAGINAHPDILRGFNLTYEYTDDEVCGHY